MRVYCLVVLVTYAAFAAGRPTHDGCLKPCPKMLEEICGSDGVTYPNQCMFENAQCLDPTLKKMHDGPCRPRVLETYPMFMPMHFKDMRELASPPKPSLIEHESNPMPVPTLIKDAVQEQAKLGMLTPNLFKEVPLTYESEKPKIVHPMDLIPPMLARQAVPTLIKDAIAFTAVTVEAAQDEQTEESDQPKPALIQHRPVPMHFKDMKHFAQAVPSLIEHEQVFPVPSLIEHEQVFPGPSVNQQTFHAEPSLIEHEAIPEPSLIEHEAIPEPSLIEHEAIPVPSLIEHEAIPEPSLIEHEEVHPEPSLIEHTVEAVPSLIEHTFEAEPSLIEHTFEAEPSLIEHTVEAEPSLIEHTAQAQPSLIEHKPIPVHFKDMRMYAQAVPSLIEHEEVHPEPSLIEHEEVHPEPSLIQHTVEAEPSLIEHEPEHPEPSLIEHQPKPIPMHFKDMREPPIPTLYSLDEGCNMACPMNYDPLCGTDGVTYANKCTMEAAACTQKKAVTMSHNGEC